MNRIPKDKSPEKTFNKRIGTKILKEMLIRSVMRREIPEIKEILGGKNAVGSCVSADKIIFF